MRYNGCHLLAGLLKIKFKLSFSTVYLSFRLQPDLKAGLTFDEFKAEYLSERWSHGIVLSTKSEVWLLSLYSVVCVSLVVQFVYSLKHFFPTYL